MSGYWLDPSPPTINVATITSISPLLLILCCKQELSGVVELTTQLSKLVHILWLPLCRIYKLGYSYPRRLSRSPTLVGHQHTTTNNFAPNEYKEIVNLFGLVVYKGSKQ